MGADLPDMTEEVFEQRLRAASPVELPHAAVCKLYLHYRELRKWNRTISLVGPGTAGEAVERHYGEALEALPLLGPGRARLLDVGSGAGFPGFVLAAAREDLRVTLAEIRERKWAFLRAACARAELLCDCVSARVGDPGTRETVGKFDYVTVRAVALSEDLLEAVRELLLPQGRLLLWAGEKEGGLPSWLEPLREREIRGGGSRHIVEFRDRENA